MAPRLTARHHPSWVADLPVSERTLDNGLKALVLPRSHAPVVLTDLYYPVGSVDEPPGKSGLAHFVEHMLFKGTDRFPKGQIDRLAFVAAGQSNAETSEDYTHYWFAFPSERWELALAVEADRMLGANFDPVEVEAERQVIIEERALDLDSPLSRLDQNHLAQSYLRHPYRNPILGWPEDLAGITLDDLRRFYQLHYRPDGAVLVVVGDVEPQFALDRIEAHFGTLPRGEPRRQRSPINEPRQTGRRDFVLHESDSVARALLGWHTVPKGHPDGPALEVLSDILTCGRRSRLWDALVEREKLATYVDAGQEGARRAGQFLVQVESPSPGSRGRIETLILQVLETLADDGPTSEELLRSKHRLDAAWRWEQEDLAGLAAGLAAAALRDDWRTWQTEYRAAVAIDSDDIRRVVSTYLVESGLTVGWSLPKPDREMTVLLPADLVLALEPKNAAPAAAERPIALTIPEGSSKLSDFKPTRQTFSNGMRLISERRPGTGIVALELFVDAGLLRETKPGLGYLVGRLLEAGTLTRTGDELAEAIEDVGGTLDLGSTGASIRVRAEDLPLAIELLADSCRNPRFPNEALAWTKKRVVAEIQGDRDDSAFRADMLFRTLVYGDHPYGRDARGTLRDIGRLTLADVREHHSRFFKADNAYLVAVGDFDTRRLRSLVNRAFGDWESSGESEPPLPSLVRSRRSKLRRVEHPGEQVQIVLGHLGVARNHPDYDALAVLDHIFGAGPGFTDRLSRIIRDELGLAYSIGGGFTDTADIAPGMFRVFVGTMPQESERVVSAVLEQVRAMKNGAFSDEEVDRARRYLAGSWVFEFQTVEQRAERLLELERWKLDLEEPLHWPDRIVEVTPKQVRQAAKALIHPEALCRVELGPIERRGRALNVGIDCA